MLKSFRNASMAIAAAGLAFAMPASAAPAMHTNSGAHAAVTGDLTFDHKRQRGHRHDRDRDYRDYRDQRDYRDYRDYRDQTR